MSDITANELRRLLAYDPTTGAFTWRVNNRRAKKGAPAGDLGRDGYWRIGIKKKSYKAHRLAWLYTYDAWPQGEIDHINRVKTDNRIHNLRDVTHAENSQNLSSYKNNVSGVNGVYLRGHKWAARITTNGRQKHLGHFQSIEDAANARALAEILYHGCRATDRSDSGNANRDQVT